MILNLLLSLAAGALLVSLYPSPGWTALAPFALAPLLVAVAREDRPALRFLWGYVTGLVYWAGVCYWIRWVLEVHGEMGVLGSYGAFSLFVLAKALHMGAFAWLAGTAIRRWYAIPVVAALWVVVERLHGPLGFAWLTLGDAAVDMGVPMRLAPYTGVYGVSFLVAAMNVAIALVALRRSRKELAWILAAPLAFLLPPLPEPVPGNQDAVIVQPNLSTTERWTTDSVYEAQQRLATLSLRSALAAGQARPRLILWPEMPMPIYYQEDARARELVTNLTRTTGTSVLLGVVAHTEAGAPLNSAILVDERGNLAGRYDKLYLVPFGEYVPPFFNWVNRITQEAGDFTPGEKLTVLRAAGRATGVFICYESAFPYLVRKFPAQGAELLVNLSNDGYFGRSAAREQHLILVRMRAAENRRWLLRATNDGITATVDPAGRIVHQLPPYAELSARTSYSYVSARTFYTQHGDWFIWLCALVAATAIIERQIPRYRRPR
ncbi:MAG: apolipoprotein N-acyltransferase [Acidobacteriales bacterium]|nr:apolipoprotein N-acyltransferase [Terriglobales bacterium]